MSSFAKVIEYKHKHSKGETGLIFLEWVNEEITPNTRSLMTDDDFEMLYKQWDFFVRSSCFSAVQAEIVGHTLIHMMLEVLKARCIVTA